MTDKVNSGDAKPKDVVFFMIKPDGMIREIDILKALKLTELEIVHSQLVNVPRDSILQHYAKNKSWYEKYGARILRARLSLPDNTAVDPWLALKIGETIPDAIADYMAEKDMRAFVIKGVNAISILRILLGDTEPASAAKDTLREIFSKDSFLKAWTDPAGPRAIHNVGHASDSQEEALREARLFLGVDIADNLFGYNPAISSI